MVLFFITLTICLTKIGDIKMELKPFHQSVIDTLNDAMKNYREYMRPSGEFIDQPVELLTKDLEVLVDLIKKTSIPPDKLQDFLCDLDNFFKNSIEEVWRTVYELKNLEPMKALHGSLVENLKSR